MHMHQVDPSSKLIGSNFDLGSQESKGNFRQKTLLLQITWHCQVTHAYPSAIPPLQNLSAQIKWRN